MLPLLQLVQQNPLSVLTIKLPHDIVNSISVHDSYKLLPAPTVTSVSVSDDHSNEYSAFVLPDSDSAGICFSYNNT